MIKNIPNGIYPTMITPFTKDNKIDYNAVLQLIEWYYKNGVNGIFAICQSSEIFFLSFEERLELLKFIMNNKPKDLCIIASGHTADDLDTQIYEANKFIDCGIDAYVFISNRLAKENESDDILLNNMELVTSKLPNIGFGVYECPYPYKRLLTPDVLRKMAETGKYLFLKDTCCNLDQINNKIDAVKNSNLKIYNANSATFLDSLKIGCAGFSGVMANFHPELYVKLFNEYKSNYETAEIIQNFIGFSSVAECQCYPINAKYYLSLEGLDININSRVKDISEFTESRKMEIQQMHNLTEIFKSQIL